jgi:large subunit ribosomal protein L29
MKIEKMLEWTPEERAAKEREFTQTLFTLRLQKSTGQLENPMKIREIRKDLARIKTASNQSRPVAAVPAAKVAAAPAKAMGKAKVAGQSKLSRKLSAQVKSGTNTRVNKAKKVSK